MCVFVRRTARNVSPYLSKVEIESAGATRRWQGVERAKTLIPGHQHQYDTSPEAPELG